jgi:hypothetical protein
MLSWIGIGRNVIQTEIIKKAAATGKVAAVIIYAGKFAPDICKQSFERSLMIGDISLQVL